MSDGRGTPKNHLDEVRMKKGMSKLNDIEKKFDKKNLPDSKNSLKIPVPSPLLTKFWLEKLTNSKEIIKVVIR